MAIDSGRLLSLHCSILLNDAMALELGLPMHRRYLAHIIICSYLESVQMLFEMRF